MNSDRSPPGMRSRKERLKAGEPGNGGGAGRVPGRSESSSPGANGCAHSGHTDAEGGTSCKHFGQNMLGSPIALMLTGEAGAVESEAVEGAEDGGGDLFGAEKFPGERLNVVDSDSFDGSKNFVESEETAKIKFLAREIGHAGACGLKGKHEGTLEMILCAE